MLELRVFYVNRENKISDHKHFCIKQNSTETILVESM